MSWRQIFPDYDVPPEIEGVEDLHDVSDHRHACPSFSDSDETVQLWVEHPDPAKREGEGRFAVTYFAEAGEDGNEFSGHTTAYDGDDAQQAVRAFMIALRDRRLRS